MANLKDLFIKLTKTTMPHGHEHLAEPFLPKGWKKDKHGNYFYIIGDGKHTTMFTCHLDTADSGQPKDVTHVIEGKMVKTDGKTILGGDDKAGAAILIHMIEHKIPGMYLFFIGEEKGCIGSRALAKEIEANKTKDIYKDLNKVIAFDRKGDNSVITYQMGERNCSDEFADALAKELNAAGGFKFIKDTGGLVTDSHHFADIYPECTNLSVGYEDQHFVREKQDVEFLQKLGDACLKVNWEALPAKRDPSKVERKSYGSTYHGRGSQSWNNLEDDDRWWEGSYGGGRSSSIRPGNQNVGNSEFVNDYLGNKVKVANSVWCEYDKQWCLKSEAIWVEYIGFYTCPDFDPAKVKKEPIAPIGGSGNVAELATDDIKVDLVLYSKDGHEFGKVTEITDGKVYISGPKDSKFIIPPDKLLTYDLFVKKGGGTGTRKLTEKDMKEGMIVYHEQFGEGKIVGIRPDRLIARISFVSKGEKDIRMDVASMKF
jgi:hypothetical protein